MLLALLAVAVVETTALGLATGRGHERAPPARKLWSEALASADLQVGTGPGKQNVVSGFEVVATWLSGDDLGASATPADRATSFYLRPSGGNLQLARAAVEPASLPFLRTHLEGELAKDLMLQGQVNLRPDNGYQLSMAYDCLSQGEAALTLTLEFEGMSALQIPFKKICGGERNTALTVTAGSIGATEKAEKVAILGTPKWDELKVIDVHHTSTVFTVSVDPLSEKGAQVISSPIASSSGACSAQAKAPSIGKQKNLAAGESTEVEVQYRCFRHGECTVSLEVPFFPDMAPYQPLRWSWTKLCGGKAIGIDVELPETRHQLLKDSPATPWTVNTNVSEHRVRLVNDKVRSLESEVKVRGLTVRCLDSKRCTSRILESVPEMLRADAPMDLHVEYECHSSGNSMVQLLLDTDGHDPVIATWAKDCSTLHDSFLGVVLFMLVGCACLASPAAAVVFMDLFMGSDKGKRQPEGEFLEDENLTPEEIAALDRYEEYYGLHKGAASIEQVKDSLGWQGSGRGWQARGAPPLPPPSQPPPGHV
jgi:hypothetical protein